MSEVFFESASELATLTNMFTVSGTPTDPTTVTLTVTDPTGSATSYTYVSGAITHTTTGVYAKNIPCTLAGQWQYSWAGTGVASDMTVGTWTVQETSLGRLYATIDALKSRLAIPATDSIDDPELHAACFAASRWIEQYCDRRFWRTTPSTARTFRAENEYCLHIPDLVAITTLKTDPGATGTPTVTWATSDYQLLPYNPSDAPETLPYTQLRAVGTQLFPVLSGTMLRENLVEITGTWGWPSIPQGIRQATLILAAETFKLKDAPGGGVAGYGDYGVIRIHANPQVQMFTDPYRRRAVLVA